LEIRIAKIISYLFHPLLMPTYGFLLLFMSNNYMATFTPFKLKLIIIVITFVFTFVLPAINTLILLKAKRIKSLHLETSPERTIPYLSTSFYFFALFYLFYNAEFPSVFIILILGAGLSILLTFLINFTWKISAHAIGIGGIIGATIGISFRLMIDLRLVIMLAILLAGIIGYARLKLNAHSPSQVYAGFLLGFLTEFLLMLFYQ
jgi:membrane-associated phospholipid phosphatase